MTRTPCRALAAVGLVVALLAYVGCTTKKDDAPTPRKAESKIETKPLAGDRLFADWTDPQAAIVISGEQLGYLEPCGCTAGQQGGLLRRFELVERLAKRKWPTALVDLGGLIKDPASARGGPEQTKIKFRTSLQALATLNYDALALSPEDLKLGVDEAVGQFLNMPGDKPKIVAANVAAAGLEAKVVPSVRTSAGPVKIGITSVVDPEALKALRDPSLDLLAAKPIDESLPGVLADLEKDTDTQILLVQGPPETAKRLATKYPAFDIVVATSPFPDPPRDAELLNDGKTLLVTVGQKGKWVGVVGVFPDPKAKYRYQRVALDTHLDGPAAPMKKVVEDEFRQTLKDQAVVENFPRHDYVNGTPGATFVGAETCKTCHANTYTRWSTTKHALAFESLLKDPKPNTAFDAECIGCHTTGFEYNSGWKSAKLTSYLKGNQCENCHGPGSKHSDEPDNKEFRAVMHLTADLADKNRLCLRCHDEDNSPHFDFSKYYGQIAHKGLDTYDDPQVHKPASRSVKSPAAVGEK